LISQITIVTGYIISKGPFPFGMETCLVFCEPFLISKKGSLFMNTQNEILGRFESDINLYDVIAFENNILTYSTYENDERVVKTMRIAF